MKKICLFFTILFICNVTFAQYKADAERLVEQGVEYHDKGDYEGAIAKYDKALKLDKDNKLALSEKAYSLLSLDKCNEAVEVCKRVFETHPDENLATDYVTYGNALDCLKKTDEALEIYEQGIKKYPDISLLYFNKGITLIGIKNYDDALISFQKAVMLNPNHASSHNAIKAIMKYEKNNIPSLLASCRFLVLENEGKRALENLQNLQRVVKSNVKETGKNTISINIDSDMYSDTTADGKNKANNFKSTEMMLAMSSALNFDVKYKKMNDVEKFVNNFEMVCSSLSTSRDKNIGFFWEYYAPYFIEMHEKKYVETFAYLAFASSDESYVAKWLKKHTKEIDEFYAWSKGFEWKKI